MKKFLLVFVLCTLVSNAYATLAVMVSPPVIDTTQMLCEGSTLGEIRLLDPLAFASNSPSVKWYDGPDAGASLLDTTTTPVVAGATYYASRTANLDGTGEESTERVSITISFLPISDTDFTYFNQPDFDFCTTDGFIFPTPGSVIALGTWSVTPALVGFNPNGSISFSEASVGIYDITYTFATTSAFCGSSTTKTITISSASSTQDNTTFSYPRTSYCEIPDPVGQGVPMPTVNGIQGGVFSSEPGLVIDSATGLVDLVASEPKPNSNPYTISYTYDIAVCGGAPTSNIITTTFRLIAYKEADFNYSKTSFCKSEANPTPTFIDNIILSESGFSFVSNDTPPRTLEFVDFAIPGTINLANTIPGSYTIIYTSNQGCAESSHSEVITILDDNDTSFGYGATFFCEGATDPIPTGSFTGGGVFSAGNGLMINPDTGVINMTGSLPGYYEITYTITDNTCPVEPSSLFLNIKTPLPVVETIQEFCLDGSPPPKVSDLVAITSINYEIRWYASSTETTPLVEDALLDEQTYHVATYDLNCLEETDRIAVEVRFFSSVFEFTPETNINGAGYTMSTNTVTLPPGQSLSLRLAEPFTGTATWTGPNGFTATGTTIDIATNPTGLSASDTGTYAATVDLENCATVTMDFELTVAANMVKVAPKAYLQGAMLGSTAGSLMRDDLRSLGHLPSTSPYADNLTITPLTTFDVKPDTADNIVDWVWVELRDALDSTAIVASQSALLQRDGDIIDTAGNSELEFAIGPGNYFIVIKHRNHLGIMSNIAVTLDNSATIVNFRDGSTPTFGTEAQTNIGMPSGTFGMWAGDANGDAVVKYLGGNIDIVSIIDTVLNDPSNNFGLNSFPSIGYKNSDVNMDGTTKYLGGNIEIVTIIRNVLNNPENDFGLSSEPITQNFN